MIEGATGQVARRTIVVDLDGTLIESDTLHEQVVRLALRHPLAIPGLLRSLFRGRAALKAYCADHVELDPQSLRACSEVIEFIQREKEQGSHVVLCSAADHRVARAVAAHLGLFDEVIATDSSTNLKGRAKADLLARRFPDGFIYAGDHPADLDVWSQSAGIVLVGVRPDVERRAKTLGKPIVAELRLRSRHKKNLLKTWARALRVHHWSKNLLMLVPVILAHEWTNFHVLGQVGIGFGLLLAITSASYFINDLADLDNDRQHATKRHRPIASGTITLFHAGLFPAIVIPLALLAAYLLNPLFFSALLAYLIVTLAYSFGLKRIPLLDTFIIGLLFTVRLIMGSTFLSDALPVWLLTFSMFFFFSLATAKRHTEIVRARSTGGDSLKSRGYEPNDWPLTLAFGITASLGSLIILVLYMVDEAFRVVGYSRPAFLWAIALFLAIWIGRVWLLTHRGHMNDDPVTFALRDRPSQLIAVLIGVCFLIAL